MIISKKGIWTVCAFTAFSFLIVSVYANRTAAVNELPLGIEIALKKPFYIPAAPSGGRGMSAVVRTPLAENVSEHEAISAVKLVPVMDGEKVKVTLTALIGDASKIISCRDFDSFKSIELGTYIAGLDEEISIQNLSSQGLYFENGSLKFTVVPKKKFPLMPPQQGASGEGCGCAGCDRLQCCPNPAQCMECGTCGFACCS